MELTPEELEEFRLRQVTLNNARFNFLMIQESYQAWVKDTGVKYNIEGKFTIDLQSGVMTKLIE